MEIRQAGQLQGWDADTLKARETDYTSGVHKNIALRIAQKDPIAADAYMKANAKQMTGADQYALSQSLETELVQEKSKREAEAILSGGRAADAPDASGASPAGGGGRRLGQAGPTRARAYLQSVSNKSPGAVDNLNDSFATNLAAMMQDAPPDIRKGLGIYSGYRSPEHQAELFASAVKRYGSVRRRANGSRLQAIRSTMKAARSISHSTEPRSRMRRARWSIGCMRTPESTASISR
jgi:hypothetical protein